MKLAFIARDDRVARERLPRLVRQLSTAGLVDQTTIHCSDYPGHAVQLASEVAGQVDVLVAVGGDGTLHEVLNGALQWAGAAGTSRLPRLGVIASGTANDFTRSIGAVGSESQFVKLLASGASRRVDLGLVNYRDRSGDPAERYFINVIDAGIGADVVSQLAASSRHWGARLTYLGAILRSFLTFRKPELSVSLDGAPGECSRTLAFVAGNGRYFGSGLCIAPGAKLDDGILDCVTIGDVSVLEFLVRLPKLFLGSRIRHPQVSYRPARAIRLESRETVGLEADGEFLGYLPASIRIIPAGIAMLLPPES